MLTYGRKAEKRSSHIRRRYGTTHAYLWLGPLCVFEGIDGLLRVVDMDDRILYRTRALTKMPVTEAPPPSSTNNASCERRRAVRVCMPEPSPVQFQLAEAHLLNISRSGALVEQTKPLWRGRMYCLSFPVQGVQVRLLARAMHVTASKRAIVPRSEEQVFRTGLQFVGLESSTAELISAYVERLRWRGQIV